VIRDLSPEGLRNIFSSFTVSLYQPLTRWSSRCSTASSNWTPGSTTR
jgi:hypothetical protein